MGTEKTRCPLTSRGGVWQKLLDVLFANLGKVVTNKKLIEVSGQHNYARRVRELRAEGWDIIYSFSPSGYILKSSQKDQLHKQPQTARSRDSHVFPGILRKIPGQVWRSRV